MYNSSKETTQVMEETATAQSPSQVKVPSVLIADDQADVLESLRLLLKGEGFEIESALSPSAIVAAVESRDFDVVLMDLNYARDTT